MAFKYFTYNTNIGTYPLDSYVYQLIQCCVLQIMVTFKYFTYNTNIGTYPLDSYVYQLIQCCVLQIMVTFSSYISDACMHARSACRSFQGMAVPLQDMYRIPSFVLEPYACHP